MLTEKQWKLLKSLLPKQDKRKGGRPRANDRKTIEGILWILKTGAHWYMMPKRYGVPSTCWRRLKRWQEDRTWERIWNTQEKEKRTKR